MIEFKHIALQYHYDDYAVLKDVSCTLINGVNTILCDSQSGKTSLCKLLTKQFKPTSGQIIVDGQDITSITNEGLGILYMSSNPTFFENRSVRYNVMYPLKVRRVVKSERLNRFDEVAELVRLNSIDVKVKKLSSEERKRVALARGLTVQRQAVLLDDFCDSARLLDEVTELFNNTLIVILTSDITFARGNVIVLDGGKTVYQGDVDGAKEVRKSLNWITDLIRSE